VDGGSFVAGGGPPGSFVDAEYQMLYTILGPNPFQGETLSVGGGSDTPPTSGYWATEYLDGQGIAVFGFGDQSQSANGLYDATLNIMETFMLSSFTTADGIPSESQFSTVTGEFTTAPINLPEPIALLLCGSGLLALGAVRYRRRR
jgi:hypothetical protein